MKSQQLSRFSKLSGTDRNTLRSISKRGVHTHRDLCKLNKKPKSTITRSLQRLEEANLITSRKKGKYKVYNLNKNKSREIFDLLDMFDKCTSILKDKSVALVRVHNLLLHVDSIKICASKFPKEKYHKYYPANRMCSSCYYDGFGSVNLHIDSGTANIHLDPFYIHYNVCEGRTPHHLSLEETYDAAIFSKYESLRAKLITEGICLFDTFKVIELSAAIINDPFASFCVRQGYKDKNIDTSLWPVPEYEEHGLDAMQKIESVLRLRKYCIAKNMSEFQLASLFEKTVKRII